MVGFCFKELTTVEEENLTKIYCHTQELKETKRININDNKASVQVGLKA